MKRSMHPRQGTAGEAESRSLGDLLGDKDWLASRETVEWRLPLPDSPPPGSLDETAFLSGLAKLAGEDPNKIIEVMRRRGGPLARVIRAVFPAMGRARKGRPLENKPLEQWLVVTTLRHAGLKGAPLKGAIEEAIRGTNTGADTWLRGARSIKWGSLAEMYGVEWPKTEAIRRAEEIARRYAAGRDGI